jgi:hypothetical protein
MPSAVPSLEGSLYLTDPQSIIAYTLRRFFRTPLHAVPLVENQIISLPWIVAQFADEPETLTSNIQSQLQNTLTRIFNNERRVEVSVNQSPNGSDGYDVTITIMYTTITGEMTGQGVTISLGKNGRLIIPEDTLSPRLLGG